MFRVITACVVLSITCFAFLATFRAVEAEKWMDPMIVGLIYVLPLVAAIVAAGLIKMHEKPPVVVGFTVIAFAAAYPVEAVALMATVAAFAASIAN